MNTLNFVAIKLDGQYFICTPIHGSINRESKVGIEVENKRIKWAPLVKVIDSKVVQGQEERELFLETASLELFFLPISNERLSGEDAETVRSLICERAIDLEQAAKNIAIPPSAIIQSYKIPRFDPRVLKSISVETDVGQKEEFKNPTKLLTGEPMFQFNLKSLAKGLPEVDGAPMFRKTFSDKEGAQVEFVGMCCALQESRTEDGDFAFVMLHPLTILSLYHQMVRFRVN